MKQIKSFLIYLIAFMFFILLSASFCSEKYLNESYSVNLSSKTLYYAFAGNLSDYLEGKIADDDDLNLDSVDKDYSKTFSEGESGDEILSYKLILYYLDYLSDTPNNTFDSTTTKAVKEYQTSRGIKETSKLDKTTMQTLDNEVVDYKTGKSSEDIKKYNYILYYLGYLTKEPNSTYTAETKVACENYQKAKSLPVTGTMTPQTRRSLDSETLTYKQGHKGDVIKDYQEILIRTGYLKGTANGTFDSKTTAAVKSYQTKKGLSVTGNLDTKTMEALDNEH
ncbi:peptidoglycan-binding domain-containing protein [Anaerofustis stercorihominis]|uniref:Peptidoglycan binding domain protein n=2 Tax=Anaerofustis stercorihominis TaxID=214853 RepID=B1CAA1_9FIRM|nr:peptidoglycan-binding protein [Anaerofustis stercorihominis]EDS72612.1 putative peptidoglycan binding domain protein [Anaerofustis stercorihominis DSM 17244]MCQ4795049.1 peptidoglycan-binding protein [Anaerofustis stercorihominis]RGD75487.1 peptidoglycan-binding protein [Anaerofustis stercorihominis]